MIRRLIGFVCACALVAAGIFILSRQMHGSPVMVLMLRGGGCLLAIAGAAWLREDFIEPWLRRGRRRHWADNDN
jgi:peptidoglycan/LPS O-acetylase OafA/YrhL